MKSLPPPECYSSDNGHAQPVSSPPIKSVISWEEANGLHLIEDKDAANGVVFILIKYLIENTLDVILTQVKEEEMHEIIRRSAKGPVDPDLVGRILMGYCMAEEGHLQAQLGKAVEIIKKQVGILLASREAGDGN